MSRGVGESNLRSTPTPPKMKSFGVLLVALVALMLPAISQAATPAQVEAWKAAFPGPSAGDSPQLRTMIAGYQQLVNQLTPAPGKTLSLLKSKLTRDQMTANNILHPARPNPRITAAMRADAEESSRWLNDRFAPYFAGAPK